MISPFQKRVKREVHVRALTQVNSLALIWAPHQPESRFDVPPCVAFLAVPFFGICSRLFGSNDGGFIAVCLQQLLGVFADFDFLHRKPHRPHEKVTLKDASRIF